MKLHSFIIAIATLVAPMIVIAQSEEEMFGKYPYCTECEANFKDAEGVTSILTMVGVKLTKINVKEFLVE